MRKLKDKIGTKLQIDEIHAHDTYVGLLEGTPYFVRKIRVISAKKYINNIGYIFDSIDELEKESTNCERDSDDWSENEHWTAQVSNGVKYTDGIFKSSRLNIAWYQKGGDPFERLNQIVSELVFEEICRIEEWDEW